MQKLALLLPIIILAAGLSLAQTSGFTYQGKLAASGAPANGDYQFQFKLFGGPTAVDQFGSTQTVVATVQNGIFTTRLDFGAAAFPPNTDLWLEIGVRSSGSSNSYEVLSPRQQLNSVPFAIRSLKSLEADNATTLNGISSTSYVQTTDSRLSDARSPLPGSASYIQNSAAQQYGNFNIIGDGTVGGTLAAGSFVGDGSRLTNIHANFLWEVIANNNFQQAHSNTGYIVTNSRQVTITLPDNAIVSDVVRVTSAAAGGWKIAQYPGQSIVLSNLSLVGGEWSAHEDNRKWSAVASSSDGSKLVAVVDPGQIYTSADAGVTWTARSITRLWTSIASSADGTKLVAGIVASLNNQPTIYTSTDSGVTWTPRGLTKDLNSIASSADGVKLVAGPRNGQIYTSNDSGVSWTARGTAKNWQGVASSADGTKLVAVTGAANGTGQIYTSNDSGVSWTQHGPVRPWQSVASSADGSKVVVVSGNSGSGLGFNLGEIYASTDAGLTWTTRNQRKDWSAVASSADGNSLIALVSNGQIYTSIDSGVTWFPHEANRNWSAVASSADGTRLVATVTNGQIYISSGSASLTTTPGTTGNLIGAQSAAVELQYVGGGVWIPISHEGVIIGH